MLGDRAFLVGGWAGEALRSVEVFDSVSGQWELHDSDLSFGRGDKAAGRGGSAALSILALTAKTQRRRQARARRRHDV